VGLVSEARVVDSSGFAADCAILKFFRPRELFGVRRVLGAVIESCRCSGGGERFRQ
jgi:hypothetical protein